MATTTLHFSGFRVSNPDPRAIELLAYGLSLAGREWVTTPLGIVDIVIAEWKPGDPLPQPPLL